MQGLRRALGVAALAAGLWTCCGCASLPNFPAPTEIRDEDGQTVLAFDVNGDGQTDYWQFQRADGRKRALAYALEGSGRAGERVELDAIDVSNCPHLVIVLDGVPFEVVDQLYREGGFRLFYPPSRVICCFPSMTDLALAKMFHAGRCIAYEAQYLDRRANRLSDANAVYLNAQNVPWLSKVDYRCSHWWDINAYLDPQAVFNHELDGMARRFRSIQTGEAYAYSVGTAGLGTRGGRPAIVKYLRTIDQLCEQIVHQRQGRVKLTLTADHGHNLIDNRRVSFRKLLESCGYRSTKSLRGPRDVVIISYGLVTYAAMYTQDPAGVAECLVQRDDVEFVCYPSGEGVVVRDRNGQAHIAKGEGGFVYDSSQADPLKLVEIVERLRRAGYASDAGEIDGQAMFRATVDHDYPDPLERLWRAFHGSVINPPDLIVNLRDGACHGSRFFHFSIGKVRSTHGSLNRRNSTTFALTMLGELPPATRSRDLLPALQALRTGRQLALTP